MKIYLYAVLCALGVGAASAGPTTMPNADTTGVTDAHCPTWESDHTVTEGRTITIDGTVIENEAVTGRLRIMARNVTLRCLIIDQNRSLYGIHCDSRDGGCPGLRIENVEVFDCDSACVLPAGQPDNPVRILRSHIHTSAKDLVKAPGNLIVEDSYLHGFDPAPGAHNDAFQSSSGSNIELRSNRIEGPFQSQTSAFIVKPDFAPIDNVIIEGNWLSGGAYTLYLRDSNSHPAPTNVRVSDNTWIRDSWQFGPLSTDTSEASCLEWSNNRYDDGKNFAGPSHGRSIGECAVMSFDSIAVIFSDSFEAESP